MPSSISFPTFFTGFGSAQGQSSSKYCNFKIRVPVTFTSQAVFCTMHSISRPIFFHKPKSNPVVRCSRNVPQTGICRRVGGCVADQEENRCHDDVPLLLPLSMAFRLKSTIFEHSLSGCTTEKHELPLRTSEGLRITLCFRMGLQVRNVTTNPQHACHYICSKRAILIDIRYSLPSFLIIPPHKGTPRSISGHLQRASPSETLASTDPWDGRVM